jgi:hypothetical protein
MEIVDSPLEPQSVARSLRIDLEMLVAPVLKDSQLIRSLPDDVITICEKQHLVLSLYFFSGITISLTPGNLSR